MEEKENGKNTKEIRIALERDARFICQFLEIGLQIDLLSFSLFVIYTNLSHEHDNCIEDSETKPQESTVISKQESATGRNNSETILKKIHETRNYLRIHCKVFIFKYRCFSYNIFSTSS